MKMPRPIPCPQCSALAPAEHHPECMYAAPWQRHASDPAVKKKLFETEIDSAELTLRIAEACLGMKRPPGMAAQDALAQLRAAEPKHIAGFDRAAMRAAEYFVECINKSGHFAEMN